MGLSIQTGVHERRGHSKLLISNSRSINYWLERVEAERV